MMLNDSKLYRSCLILLCCVAFSWSFIEAKMWGNGRPEMSKKKITYRIVIMPVVACLLLINSCAAFSVNALEPPGGWIIENLSCRELWRGVCVYGRHRVFLSQLGG